MKFKFIKISMFYSFSLCFHDVFLLLSFWTTLFSHYSILMILLQFFPTFPCSNISKLLTVYLIHHNDWQKIGFKTVSIVLFWRNNSYLWLALSQLAAYKVVSIVSTTRISPYFLMFSRSESDRTWMFYQVIDLLRFVYMGL